MYHSELIQAAAVPAVAFDGRINAGFLLNAGGVVSKNYPSAARLVTPSPSSDDVEAPPLPVADAAKALVQLKRKFVLGMGDDEPTKKKLRSVPGYHKSTIYGDGFKCTEKKLHSAPHSALDPYYMCSAPEPVRPKSLAMPDDKEILNKRHCLVRSKLLEIIYVSGEDERGITSNQADKRFFAGRVGLRCPFCAHVESRSDEAKKPVFYPRTISHIYREVSSFQQKHVKYCSYIPSSIVDEYKKSKDVDKTRGSTRYWEKSCKALGMGDVVVNNEPGIMWMPPGKPSSCTY